MNKNKKGLALIEPDFFLYPIIILIILFGSLDYILSLNLINRDWYPTLMKIFLLVFLLDWLIVIPIISFNFEVGNGIDKRDNKKVCWK